jgi:prepilin-type N-terminal cleavage/methylation domain-containing protein
MILNNIKHRQGERGFTIVELLVVIVVIGILAAITIVSYTGITARANTAAGQSSANAAVSKINAYMVDTPYSYPTSYGSITGAASTTTYSASNLDFTTISTAAGLANKDMTAFRPAGIVTDSIDFSLCGTSGTGTIPTAYASTSVGAVIGITVPSGIILGYWDYAGSGSLNVSNTIGTTSGNYLTYPVACFKVGIAESAVAVAKAMFAENGTWPVTAASINANTATSAKLPAGLTVNVTVPVTGTGTTAVQFQCGVASAGVGPCLTGAGGGGRIAFWDYSIGTPAVAYVNFGTAGAGLYWTPAT